MYLKKWWSKLERKSKINKVDNIVKKIKNIDIQGARNIAKAAIKAYKLRPTKTTKKKLMNSRPTEPMLVNTLKKFEELSYEKTLQHFNKAQQEINKQVLKLLKKKRKKLGRKLVIFTHCHSSNVVNSLIYSSKEVDFEVYNTETRPLYQGRKTSKELSRAGIEVTTFTDDAARIALKALQESKKSDLVFLGSDAILEDGIINKIGSAMFAEIAKQNDIPVYIIADSWKYTNHVELEERDFREIWKNKPKNVKVRNLAFEKVPKKCIKRVISELGTYTLKTFIKKAKKN